MTGKEYYEFSTEYARALKKAVTYIKTSGYTVRPVDWCSKGEQKAVEYLEKELKLVNDDIETCFVDEI